MKPLPPENFLKEKLSYNPSTGVFTRITSGHGVKSGDICGTERHGYIYIKVFGTHYRAHRLAWVMMTGQDPGTLTIDHINGKKNDNSWSNLRLATHSQQQMNKVKRKGLTSTYRGVNWCRRKGMWEAKIRINGKQVKLGYFTNELDAHLEYKRYSEQYHGDFSNCG